MGAVLLKSRRHAALALILDVARFAILTRMLRRGLRRRGWFALKAVLHGSGFRFALARIARCSAHAIQNDAQLRRDVFPGIERDTVSR